MSGYGSLDHDNQVAALTPVAVAGAAALGLEVEQVELAHHGYNTTFGVRTVEGRRYAVRVLTNSASRPEQLEAQHAWMQAIARETDVVVPVPVTGPDGATWAAVPSEELEREVTVVAASWLPGADLEVPSLEHAHELGVVMATLHDQASVWDLPDGTTLPAFTDPLLGDEDLLTTLECSAADADLLAESLQVTRHAFERTAAQPQLPIHGDLHGGNLKWYDGRLAVFDFDDSGIATTALDLATTTFYLREETGTLEAGLREGYQAIRALPEIDVIDFEALVASRQLLLANALMGTSTASLRQQAQDYLQTSFDRLRRWHETGRFTRVLT